MQHDFILLDRSQSMSSQWSEALASVNLYVKKLAKEKVDTGVTLATFDGVNGELQFEVLRDRITPSTWHPVTAKEATPRGMTPLSDATGRIVQLARAGHYDKVAIIIMTDGAENASKEITVNEAKSMLDECRDKKWQVIFLGASFDNAAQGASYGNLASATASVAKGKLGSSMAFAATKRAEYGTRGIAMNYSDAEKADLATENPKT